MINRKKGYTAQTTLIAAVVVAFVIVIVVLWVGGGLDAAYDRFLLFLQFNSSIEAAQNPGLVRYNINQDQASYYDGISWIEFENENEEEWNRYLKLTDVWAAGGPLRYYFSQYYYDWSKRTPQTPVFEFSDELRDAFSDSGEIIGTKYENAPVRYISDKYQIITFNQDTKGTIYLKIDQAQLFTGNTNVQEFIYAISQTNKLTRVEEEQAWPAATTSTKNGKFFTTIEKSLLGSKAKEHLRNINGKDIPFDVHRTVGEVNILRRALDEGKSAEEVLGSEVNIVGTDYSLVYAWTNKEDVEIQLSGEKIKATDHKIHYQLTKDSQPLNIYYKVVVQVSDIEYLVPITSEDFLEDTNIYPEINQFTHIGEPEQEIINTVTAWRDSVLNIPITISQLCNIEEKDASIENCKESRNYCVQTRTQNNEAYLLVDLEKPTTASTC